MNISGYKKELEDKFKVKRDYYDGISEVTCIKENLKECLDYVETSAFFPGSILLTVEGYLDNIVICRNNLSGRVYIDESKSSMWDKNYPQCWNDKRIYKEIVNSLHNKKNRN